MNEQTIMTLVGQAGIGGILAWYLYYTVTVAQPRIIAEFRADLAEERRQRNGLFGTLRDMVMEMRERPCLHGTIVTEDEKG